MPNLKVIQNNKYVFSKLSLLLFAYLTVIATIVYLAGEVSDGNTLLYDRMILDFIYQYSSPSLDRLFLFVTSLGSTVMVTAVSAAIAGYLLHKKMVRQAMIMIIGVGGAGFITRSLKLLFERARPDLWTQIITETSYSFPSGHAMGSSALAFCVVAILWRTKWRTVAIVISGIYVFIIGLSRLYLGVHYPSDILAAWLIALVWVATVVGLLHYRSFQNLWHRITA